MELPKTYASNRPAIVITGATSGIGLEIARFAAREPGAELVLVARSAERLSAVASEIAALGATAHPVALDLARAGAANELLATVDGLGLHVDVLVNNAAFGLVGLTARLPRIQQEEMVALNVTAATSLALAVLPGMVSRGRGGILNVASVAGFLPGPRMAVYYATKAYLQSFTEALAVEASGTGVTVTSLTPGPVETGFLARATGRPPGFRLTRSPFHVDASEVARQGWEGFRAGRRMVVPGLLNRLAIAVVRLAPRPLLIWALIRYQAKRPEHGS